MARNKMIPGLIMKSILNSIVMLALLNRVFLKYHGITSVFDRSHRGQEIQDLLCQLPNARHSIHILSI